MSGGVDSAVALLRAGPTRDRRDAPPLDGSGRTRRRARMLLAERGDRRTRGVPSSRPAARDARPSRGVPPRDRRAVHQRLRARRDAQPVHRLQRELPLRRTARLRRARRRVAPRNGSLRAHRPAPRPAPARMRGRSAQGPELHARATRSALPRPPVVSARDADEGGDARGGRARRPRCGAAAREPGGVLPRRRRLPRLPRPPRPRDRARPDRRRGRTRARVARRLLALHAGPAPRASASRRRTPLFALRTDARTNTVTVGPRASLATTTVRARGRLYADVERVHAKLRYRSPSRLRQPSCRTTRASISTSTTPVHGVAPGQAAVLYENDVVVGAGLISA